MLTQVGVEGEDAELIMPILGVTPKESLLINTITGLNPPDLDLFLGEFSRDGGTYQGRRVGNRNVVMTLDLNPNPALGETVSGLRELLYKTFVDPLVDADHLKINLYDDRGGVRYLVGYTEKFETEVFSVETMAQISMICPDPYLREDSETVHTNDLGWLTVPFTYQGSAETGFEVEIKIVSATDTLILSNNTVTEDPEDPRYYRGRMVFDRSFSVNDVVKVGTIRGSRYATVTPPLGAETSIIGTLSPLSPWLELHSQRNIMKIRGDSLGNASIRELRYTPTYWGI